MIQILNTGPSKPRERSNLLGERNYEVRVPAGSEAGAVYSVVATFTHTRANGLAALLLQAHKAVKAQERRAGVQMKRARKALAK